MNRKQKSSLILAIIALVMIPVLYFAYELAGKISTFTLTQSSQIEEVISQENERLTSILKGKWKNIDADGDVWEFTSDSTVLINQKEISFEITNGMLLIHGKEEKILSCVKINDNEIKMVNMKPDLSTILDGPKMFTLQKIMD